MSELVQECIINPNPRGIATVLCNLLDSLSITSRITPDQSEDVVKICHQRKIERRDLRLLL
jgi:hypothetical protein